MSINVYNAATDTLTKVAGLYGSTPSVPDGKTVTPINDVTIWQQCAGLNSTYTTLDEILADTGILSMLMASDNAVDYLVRSKDFIGSGSGIVDSSAAMTYIGANDYTTDTLLADSDWCEGICSSEYFESVLNVKVPTMTSNTEPSGTASANSTISSAGWEAYRGFDNNDNTFWAPHNYGSVSDAWLMYEFPSSVKCYGFSIEFNSQYINSVSYEIQGGDNYLTLSNTFTEVSKRTAFNQNIGTYSKYRLFINSMSVSGGQACGRVTQLQFYGREKGGVQSLLRAADITDKTYTTIDQLLNDTTTLAAVIASEDAIDYLVTCKGWTDEFTNDQNAMTAIGASNYASNTLLADSTWREAICNSTYRESVLNFKLPVMTSATAPKGTASASGTGSGAPYAVVGKQETVSGLYCNWSAGYNSSAKWWMYDFDDTANIFITEIYGLCSNWSEHSSGTISIEFYISDSDQWETAESSIGYGYNKGTPIKRTFAIPYNASKIRISSSPNSTTMQLDSVYALGRKNV